LRSIDREITLVAQEIGEEEEESANDRDNQEEETRQPVVSNEGDTVAEERESRDVNCDTTASAAAVSTADDGPTSIEESTTGVCESTDPTEDEAANDNAEADSSDDKIASEDREDMEANEGKSSTKANDATTTFENMPEDDTAPEATPEDDSDAASPVAAMAKTTKNTLSLGYSLAAAFIIKPHPTSELGITIGEKTLMDGSQVPVILEITPDGLCSDTDLEVGMRILSVDGIGCRGAEDATKMLSEAEGDTVTILASLSWHMVFATVTKPTKDTKTGLTMRRNGNGMIVIKRLPSDGLFAQTGLLKEGMRICCINGTDVDELKEEHILQLVSSAEGTVTVLAENLNHCLAD
jgi:PDZ domain